MKIFKRILLGIAALIGLILVVLAVALLIDWRQTSYLETKKIPGAEQNSYVITNVNLVPMTADTVIRNTSITIVDGMIEHIGDNPGAGNLPVLDAQGAYLSPGLIDMHVHVWDEYELGLYLANGVTAVRNVWGQPMHLRMKRTIEQEKIPGPMFFTSGPKLTGSEFQGDDNLSLHSPEEARSRVASYKKRGYDFIKTYYGLTEELFDAILAECRKDDFDIVAHATPKVPYAYHFKPRIRSIEHAEDIVQLPLEYKLDTAKLEEVVDLYARHPQTSFCPTLVVYHNIYRLLTEDDILSGDDLNYMNPLIRKFDSKAQYDRWSGTKARDPGITEAVSRQHQFHLLAVRKLQEKGVNIIAGTDAGIGVTLPGFSIHEELAFYTEAGMSNYEALKTATANPSRVHRFLNNMGTIAPGKHANLVLTKENPLENLATLKEPEMVFVRGRKLERGTLDKFVDKAAHRSNFLVSVMRYVENRVVER